jgi:cobalt-precorrin-6B (C15)-methyltransferase
MWRYKTPGIPDDMFIRSEDIPITKEEIRSIIISKARLKDGYKVIDVGSGSGSITVEASLQVGNNGLVYAIDKDDNAIEITRANINRFKLSNVQVIKGDAEDILPKLPIVDIIFIGGMGGSYNIIRDAYNKIRDNGRIVISTILLESIYNVLNILNELNCKDIDITQAIISKSKRTSTGTLLLARNPVTIIRVIK